MLFIDLGEASFQSLFLSRVGTGENILWSSRLEHSIRFQRIRYEDICETVTDIH